MGCSEGALAEVGAGRLRPEDLRRSRPAQNREKKMPGRENSRCEGLDVGKSFF